MSSGAKFEKRSKHGKTQSYNCRAYHSFATPIAVSLQLNGMLMMWKMQQAKQDDVIRATLLPCCSLFQPAHWVLVGKTEISGTEPACPLIWTHRKFLDLDWTLVKRHLDGKLTSFCLNTNYPAYADLLAFTGELLIMKRWLPLLRDWEIPWNCSSLYKMLKMYVTWIVCCLSLIFLNVLNPVLPRCSQFIAYT